MRQGHYDIYEHKHRFAAWAAARAAASSPNCRFSVEKGRKLLEAIGFRNLIRNLDNLPNPRMFDKRHRAWRKRILLLARKKGTKTEVLGMTHGVAAKLINVYLKAIFVCSGHHDEQRVRVLHPPIDRLLLGNLGWRKIGSWSKFDSETYERVIDCMRERIGRGESLWKIEEHWQGFQ
jgi:hypothetical protein